MIGLINNVDSFIISHCWQQKFKTSYPSLSIFKRHQTLTSKLHVGHAIVVLAFYIEMQTAFGVMVTFWETNLEVNNHHKAYP